LFHCPILLSKFKFPRHFCSVDYRIYDSGNVQVLHISARKSSPNKKISISAVSCLKSYEFND
jgi:hypothetical protein